MRLGHGILVALIRRPVLFWEAVRARYELRGQSSDVYLRWRQVTAYGDNMTTTSAQDLVNYLAWRREMRTIRKWERVA